MDTISIINSRENELQFDISVDGTDVSEMCVRFVIDTENINYVFLCNQSDVAAKWNVKIPAMPYLKFGTYDFHIEIITNGYYFNPYNGSIEVTSEPTVSQSEVSRHISTPIVNTVEIKEHTSKNNKITKSNTTEDNIVEDSNNADGLVDAFLKNKNKKIKVVSKISESTKPETKKAKRTKTPIKKRTAKQTTPIKKRTISEAKITETKQSTLSKVIENIDTPTDPQALKVRNIINSINTDT